MSGPSLMAGAAPRKHCGLMYGRKDTLAVMAAANHVLIVDDDLPFRTAMGKALQRRGFDVQAIGDGAGALEAFKAPPKPGSVRVAILDLRMPGMDGLEVLRQTPQRALPVIVLSGHGGIPSVVEAMQLGAYTFMSKPVDAADLVPILKQAVKPRLDLWEYTGESPESRELRRLLPRMADSSEPVLVIGENGVGKAFAASLLHRMGGGRPERFIRLSPTHLTDEALEARLNDLWNPKDDQYDAEATLSTIYVDELTELPLHHQQLLCRWVDLAPGERLASSRKRAGHTRLVLGTQVTPLQSVRRGRFDEALFYRLQVLPIVIPPLRDRQEDVLPIARSWMRRIAGEEQCFTACATEAILKHTWPGNVRELVNLVRRASLFGSGGVVDGPLVCHMLASSPFVSMGGHPANLAASSDSEAEEISLEALERRHIENLMMRHQNISRVSRILQINRRTLQRKLRSWGMDHSDFECVDPK